MKLDFPSIDIKTSGKFTSASFGFGDTRVIMDILRSKMYSNPIRAISQEVMSNARDANREVGRGDIPIEITLPSSFDENISFKDCGPGISPDSMENVFIRYGSCLSRGTRVWLENRVTEIENVMIGEKAWTHSVDGELVLSNIIDVVSNGKRKLFKLKTLHREILATDNHPFLVERFDGKREFVELKDLQVLRHNSGGIVQKSSPKLVLLANQPESGSLTWKKILGAEPSEILSARDDTKQNNYCPQNQIKLTSVPSDDFGRLFGFMLGDGWISKYKVSFARGIYPELNTKYESLLSNFGLKICFARSADDRATVQPSQAYVNSTQLAAIFKAAGWINGFANKRIPSWIFSAPKTFREEFLAGFIDADGWTQYEFEDKNTISFEISNEKLAIDFKQLIDGLGYKSGKIRSRFRDRAGEFNGKEIRSTCPSFTLTYSTEKFTEDFVSERLLSVDECGEDEVFDIAISSDVHNFIANGLVVHNSTKRDDNTQTGGFGLGAKTPFAYGDSFNIVTTSEENGKRTKRTYVAYIDTTQMGAMTLVSEVPTEEPTGTIISLGVKRQDNEQFASMVRFVGSYWNPRPIIKNRPTWDWNETKYKLQTADYAVLEHGESSIIVDGIPYKIRHDVLFPAGHPILSHKDLATLKHVLSSSFHFFFRVGELSVTANREDLDYQPHVISAIHNRALIAVAYINEEVEKIVKGAKDLWDASLLWKEHGQQFSSFIAKPQWKGHNLLDRNISPTGIYENIRSTVPGQHFTTWRGEDNFHVWVYENLQDHGPKLIKRYRGQYERNISVERDWLILESPWDVEKPNVRRLETAFELNPTMRRIAVVAIKDASGLIQLEKHFAWSQIPVGKLEDYAKSTRVAAKRGKYSVHKVKILSHMATPEWIADDNRTAEDNLGGVYVVINSGDIYVTDKVTISKYELSLLRAVLGCEIHGMLFKWKKNVSNSWTPLLDKVVESVKVLEGDKGLQHILKCGQATISNHSATRKLPEEIWKKLAGMKLSQGPFRTWVRSSAKSHAKNHLVEKHTALTAFLDNFKSADARTARYSLQSPNQAWLRKLYQIVNKRYPMLSYISHRNLPEPITGYKVTQSVKIKKNLEFNLKNILQYVRQVDRSNSQLK